MCLTIVMVQVIKFTHQDHKNMACMEYMDTDVCCPKKLLNLITHSSPLRSQNLFALFT